MIENAAALIDDFKRCHALESLEIVHEGQPCPHQPHELPRGKCGVYVFSVSPAHGAVCNAGPNRVLKVGKAGPNSNARFQSQHYNPGSSRSNLSKALINSKGLWPYLGITIVDESTAATWIKQHLDRDNFYLDAGHAIHLDALEKYIRARYGPAFEGG